MGCRWLACAVVAAGLAQQVSARDGRSIIVCRGPDGQMQLQDHACGGVAQNVDVRARERARLLEQMEQARQNRPDGGQAIKAADLGAGTEIVLYQRDGKLRDAKGRLWSRVSGGFIDVMSGEQVPPDRVRVQTP